MRPSVGGSTVGAPPRKRSFAEPETSAAPTTFFIASERQLDAGQTPTASITDSSFGVRSLGEEPAPAEADSERDDVNGINARRRSTIKSRKAVTADNSMDSTGLGSVPSSESSSPSRLQKQLDRLNNIDSASHPLTPLSFASPSLNLSEPSSPKSMSSRSLRPSDDELLDDQSSQAILSDGEDDPEAHTLAEEAGGPQFIMPSIMMPSRRPFTARGQELGKLKVLLAGRSGVGKTSLIRSIVQLCDDIVHIDSPLSTSSPPKKESKSKSRHGASSYSRTKKIMEIFASTKAYPSWWSDLEDSKLLRRRRSGNDTVLERNLCFIDTPGFDAGTSVLEGMEIVSQYIEAQMNKNLDVVNLDDAELLSVLGGSGGSQVDVVFYISDRAYKPEDIEFMRQLSQLANVIPLLAKADIIETSELEQLKASMTEALTDAGIKTFKPTINSEAFPTILTVCSSPSKDLENMDASLLMQSDYIQPLHPSQLSQLLDSLFSKDTLTQLKHFSAKKLLHYRKLGRNTAGRQPSPFRTSLSPPGFSRSHTTTPLLTDSFSSVSQALIARPSGGAALTYAQAQFTDHTLREERLARVHLANWAANLQRSLQNERVRYATLAQAERSEWLKARLGECLLDGEVEGLSEESLAHGKRDLALVPSSSGSNQSKSSSRKSSNERRRPNLPTQRRAAGESLLDPADPLGLMRFGDNVRNTGWAALKVVGVSGVITALVVWAARTWNFGIGAGQGEWMNEWWDRRW